LVGEVLFNASDRLPDALAGGEGHSTQTDFGNKKAGGAKRVVFHRGTFAGLGLNGAKLLMWLRDHSVQNNSFRKAAGRRHDYAAPL
jgi:hypothetical protein